MWKTSGGLIRLNTQNIYQFTLLASVTYEFSQEHETYDDVLHDISGSLSSRLSRAFGFKSDDMSRLSESYSFRAHGLVDEHDISLSLKVVHITDEGTTMRVNFKAKLQVDPPKDFAMKVLSKVKTILSSALQGKTERCPVGYNLRNRSGKKRCVKYVRTSRSPYKRRSGSFRRHKSVRSRDLFK